MENMGLMPAASFWHGRRVLVTGHTGFKGGWLTLWLASMGARVSGIALAPPDGHSLFDAARVAASCDSFLLDIRDAAALHARVAALDPEIVFHGAAQPLVRLAYADPVGTWKTNVMGTIHLLEALRDCAALRAVVAITSDKCYDNRETGQPFREDDALGGLDPYSSSKAATELAVASWRHAFFGHSRARVASARAGNVIGGGDWATDRLVPDLLAGFTAGKAVAIRHPEAVRPWQHVLEPLAGYLLLAERLVNDGVAFEGAWNFGPAETDVTVGQLADRLQARCGPQARWQRAAGDHPHEARLLALDSGKARQRLGWQPRYDVDVALDATVAWHEAWCDGADMQATTFAQIASYMTLSPT